MRVDNWASLLNDEVDLARATQFQWGKTDCALFVADCVLAMTGFDWAKPFRGKYKTAKGSLSALKKHGKGTLEKTVDADFVRHDKPVLARRGDVVLFENETGHCLGVCVGTQAAFRSPDGIAFIPLSKCLTAWVID